MFRTHGLQIRGPAGPWATAARAGRGARDGNLAEPLSRVETRGRFAAGGERKDFRPGVAALSSPAMVFPPRAALAGRDSGANGGRPATIRSGGGVAVALVR